MYSVILTNGEIIGVAADDDLFCEKTKTMRLFNKHKEIARINIDKIAGVVQNDVNLRLERGKNEATK